jgi:hypothetical protein
MRFTRNTFRMGVILSLVAAVACDRAGEQLTAPSERPAPDSPQNLSITATSVSVTNVEQLYAAVNDAANAGAAILVSPGRYVLSLTDGAGHARPNRGRLEFQRDMSLYGVTGDRGAVVIDASALPDSTFNVSFGRTAPIRIGRGSNTVEWLTIVGNPAAAAGIATELAGTPTTNIRVAHIFANESSRGVDIRNVSATMIGRRIDAEIIDNELVGPSRVVGMSEGIRVANFVGADNGVIFATLSGNRVYGFQLGCIMTSNRSSNATVDIRSSGDRFVGNALGCLIAGGLSQAATGVANSNVTTFEAHGTQFVDNTAQIPGIEPGGVRVVGGLSTVKANATSDNRVTVDLWGSKVSGNQIVDFEAFGAWKAAAPGIAGTNNHATITLHGVSKQIDVAATSSFPTELAATNTVMVIR